MPIRHTKRPCSICGKPNSNNSVHKRHSCPGKPKERVKCDGTGEGQCTTCGEETDLDGVCHATRTAERNSP